MEVAVQYAKRSRARLAQPAENNARMRAFVPAIGLKQRKGQMVGGAA